MTDLLIPDLGAMVTPAVTTEIEGNRSGQVVSERMTLQQLIDLTLANAATLELIRDTMGTALVAGTNVTVTPNDGADTITIAASGGSGDVVGPASSTDNALVRFDSTTGKLVQNSTGATLADNNALTIATGAVTTNTPAGTFTQTWNDGAVDFYGLHVSITNTASSATSDIARFQIADGSYVVRINKTGAIFAPTINATGSITSDGWAWPKTKLYLGASASAIGATADGTFTFFKSNETSAGVVRPGAMLVAALPAAATAGAGAAAFVTDANATTARSTVAGGGANFVQVMCDGTNWMIVA